MYLQARFEWNKRTDAGLLSAIDYFNWATEFDSTFSLAWAGLADAYTITGARALLPAEEAFPRSNFAAGRAVESDSVLDEGRTSLGTARLFAEWNWPGYGQDSNYLIPVDSIEARLRDGDLHAVDVHGSRVQGDDIFRITLMYPDSSVFVAKLAIAPVGGSAFNDEPRYELAAYAIQKLFLDQDQFVVPPAVARVVPLT